MASKGKNSLLPVIIVILLAFNILTNIIIWTQSESFVLTYICVLILNSIPLVIIIVYFGKPFVNVLSIFALLVNLAISGNFLLHKNRYEEIFTSPKITYYTAIHEMSHCVMAETQFPGSVKLVKLLDAANYTPRNMYYHTIGFVRYKTAETANDLQYELKMIRVYIAGMIGECMDRNIPFVLEQDTGDFGNAVKYVRILVNRGYSGYTTKWEKLNEKEKNIITEEIFNSQIPYVQNVLVFYEYRISDLVQKLMVEKLIIGNDVRTILNKDFLK